ncbi:hypothetical protein BP6252_13985 [Coleophoma cylindrospora]|uniref:Allantoin permease n=1 Tax=Coleophoma cylindrospora TaxID=1849047 RepID=A0A3D8Q4M6_9HELO|nr:hypothetical protein BP6252_13985 [Coleophoma cylindrospora]
MSHYATKLKDAFSSGEKFKEAIRADGSGHSKGTRHNSDLLPTPIQDRKWRWQHYFACYLTTSLGASSYNLGASFVATGLLWWHGMVAAAIGGVILTCLLILNSRGATQYYVGFPVYVRVAGGVRGANLYILCRASVATIYFATQTYYGGRMTSVLLRAIFGNSFYDIPNHLPASAGITSRDLLGFFIFWIVQFPIMFIHPKLLRRLFVVKALFSSAALFGVLGWAIHMNGGSLGSFKYTTSQKSLSGKELIWPMISAINSVMGALSPLLINQPDIARYAHSYNDVTFSQAAGVMTSKVMVIFIGAATTSAATEFLGKSYWNIWDLYNAILTTYWSSGARAGIAFASIGVMLAIMVTNAGSNSMPVGADITGIWPRWLTIVRGQVACALIAPLLVPWKIISSASAFLTFLGSYTVFLLPILACMVVDYWVVRRGNFHVPSLYVMDPTGPYYYYKGWNLRMLVAWICGVAFTVHGVAGSLRPESVSQASKDMYKLGFILSGSMSGALYYIFCLIWPVAILPASSTMQEPLEFEQLAISDGYLEGESVQTITGVIDALDGERISQEEFVVEGKSDKMV